MPERAGPAPTPGQRLGVRMLIALSAMTSRLPAAPLHRVAHLVGVGWYLAAPGQRALARANLQRVCAWLDANGMASPRVSRAARDPARLESMLRQAFGHRARYYLEVVMNERVTAAFVSRHMSLADPVVAGRELGRPGPSLVIGLHLGALELPAQYLTVVRGRRAVAPMETLRNAPLQAYMERTRARTGVQIVPSTNARPILERTLANGDLVGLIADRDISGRGIGVELFGATTRLPAGPGVLAVETGVPVFAAAAIRAGWDAYRAYVIPLQVPATGTRGERARAFIEEVARAFERLVAEAPEQWWSIFQPLWETP